MKIVADFAKAILLIIFSWDLYKIGFWGLAFPIVLTIWCGLDIVINIIYWGLDIVERKEKKRNNEKDTF